MPTVFFYKFWISTIIKIHKAPFRNIIFSKFLADFFDKILHNFTHPVVIVDVVHSGFRFGEMTDNLHFPVQTSRFGELGTLKFNPSSNLLLKDIDR